MDNEQLGIMYNPPHAGEMLKENYLEPLGISVTEAAAKLGMSRKCLSEVINGKTGISAIMALRLSKAFNTTPQYWMNLQQQYELWQAYQNMNFDDVQVIYNGVIEEERKAS